MAGNDVSRALAATLAADGAPGFVGDSLRRAGGHRVAIVSPRALTLPVREIGRLRCSWSAARAESTVERLSPL